jgi:hypothetical protein
MTATDEPTPVQRYLEQVRAELADLPTDDQSDLLEEVEGHLADVAAETEAPLEVRLGSPAVYAAELRAAAGLPARADADDEFSRRMAARLAASRLGQVVRRDVDRLNSSSAYRGLRSFLPELRPAWWVLRAWAALQVLAALTSHDPGWHLVPNVGDHPALGVALLIPAVIASVRIGRQPPSWTRRRLLPLANAALAVGALVAAVNVNTGQYAAPRYDEFVNATSSTAARCPARTARSPTSIRTRPTGHRSSTSGSTTRKGRPVIAGSRRARPSATITAFRTAVCARTGARAFAARAEQRLPAHREPIYDPAPVRSSAIDRAHRHSARRQRVTTPTVTPHPAPSAVTGLSSVTVPPSASPSTASSASGQGVADPCHRVAEWFAAPDPEWAADPRADGQPLTAVRPPNAAPSVTEPAARGKREDTACRAWECLARERRGPRGAAPGVGDPPRRAP